MNTSKAISVSIAIITLLSGSHAHADDFCAAPSALIPDNAIAGVTIPIEIEASANALIDTIEVSIEINHAWVGDLSILLRSPNGTEIALLHRPGIPSTGFPGPFGCGGRDINALFTDQSAQPAELLCSYDAQPVITGQVAPNQMLSVFAGQPAAGTWLIIVADHSPYDQGTLISVCLSTNTTTSCSPDLNNDGNLDFFDVSAFLGAFSTMNPIADFTNDGEFNFFDVSAFLSAFSAGCP